MAKVSKFYEKIKNSLIEREVEDVYNTGLEMYFQDAPIMHPYACDGLIDTKQDGKLLKLLIEYKYDENFASKTIKAKVITQVLFYLKQFELDCLVYSTFRNYCCSYKLDNNRPKNEFFWMLKDEMVQLANENNNDECYNDALTSDERYVYTILRDRYDELSEQAKALLEAGRALVRDSFKYRTLFNDEEPKYQINNWDAGWYQIKQLCNMYMPERMKEFRKQFNAFGKYIEPQVYELGFLCKQ